VVILENHWFSQIIMPSRAPYICDRAANGALFVNVFGVSHPSAPNYFALFSQDACAPHAPTATRSAEQRT
jgi:phosphatidylinositol-3-phosphatase